MSFREISVIKGWPETMVVLREWRTRPLSVVLPWFMLSFFIAVGMLLLTYLIALASTPDPTKPTMPFEMATDPMGFLRHIIRGNLLVLALHAVACLAGYITHVALPNAPTIGNRSLALAQRLTGIAALVFVPFATLFSIGTQSWVLGERLSTLSLHLHLGKGQVILSVVPHAVLELTAVFLPLAAWMIAARSGNWQELIAATLVTVCVAVPLILIAAEIEVRTWPRSVADLQQAYHPPDSITSRSSLERMVPISVKS
jgi:hypothetical protein